jgi:dTDP-4-dehydrorhamnose 3,5-epimerase
MNVTPTAIPEVLLIEPKIFGDSRGLFVETYNAARYRAAGIDCTFVQDNLSRSMKGVLRGLHYQVEKPQAKLVTCLRGRIWDVAVDIRPGSPTYGRWVSAELDAVTRKQFLVPIGFAHGFCVLEDDTEVLYKCSDEYYPAGEGALAWNCPEIAIQWPIVDPSLSAKDAAAPPLSKARPFPAR